jgi:hypothetical protein
VKTECDEAGCAADKEWPSEIEGERVCCQCPRFLGNVMDRAKEKVAELAKKMPAKDDLSHTTRFSDSSIYDEVCTKCGATDAAGDTRLRYRCPGERK